MTVFVIGDFRQDIRKHTERLVTNHSKMASLRLITSAARRASSITLARRGYAEVNDKLKLSLVLPHQVRLGLPQCRV